MDGIALIRISKSLQKLLAELIALSAVELKVRSLFKPAFLNDEDIYTDASATGLGIIFPSLRQLISFPFDLSPWIPQKYCVNKRISIPGVESLAVVIALLIRCSSLRFPLSRHFTVYTDSLVFIKAKAVARLLV